MTKCIAHSIIVPQRNRVRELRQTLWSIHNAANAARDEFEVIIVHANQFRMMHGVDVDIVDSMHPRVFNKPRLLNLGIEAAKGDLLTFLDADMIVGPHWLHATQKRMLHTKAPPTRLCYRVRQLRFEDSKSTDSTSYHEQTLQCWEQAERQKTRTDLLEDVCSRAECFAIAAEGYGRPEWTNKPNTRTPVFGNSQWSILRDVLGDLRFDEAYEGAGFEDLDMIDTIWYTVPDYRGEILTKPEDILYHLHHARPSVLGNDWCDPKLNLANQRRYARNSAERRRIQQERKN